MNNSKFPLLITLFTVMIFVLGSCTDDPCDGTDCGANGVPIEDVVFGTCECQCDVGFTNGPNGNCVSDACLGVECGLGESTITADNMCFCNCPAGTVNNDDGLGCVEEVVCDDTNCINGDCNEDGTCDCNDNFEGETCETLSLAKFLGGWTVTETCIAEVEVADECESFTDEYDVTLVENGTSETNVIIEGFFGSDTFSALVADISGDDLVVTLQSNDSVDENVQTSGEGVYSIDEDGVETITYSYVVQGIEDESVFCTVNCTSTWVRN